MTDKTNLIREIHEYVTAHGGENTATHLLVQAASAIQTQAAEMEAVGAGGVSGPLMGRPQAMPDLSALTERGAKAWTAVDAQGLREGFTAADMATAEARGFRDGAASAMAGEPMAWMTFTEEGDPDMVFLDRLEACQYCEDDDPPKPLYLAAPPTAQAKGWRSMETAPRDGTEVLANTAGLGRVVVYWDDEESKWGTGLGYLDRDAPTHWMPLPPPPTSAEGVQALSAAPAEADSVLEDAALSFTIAHIDYVARYGGRCRDCADESGVCPGSGLPCGNPRKAIKHVFDALEYGVKNGFIELPNASRAKPAAALLTETCPGAPNFDGGAAYELAMNIDAALAAQKGK